MLYATCVPDICRVPKKALDPMGLELQMVVSCLVGAVNKTLVLWKSSQWVSLLSHLSSSCLSISSNAQTYHFVLHREGLRLHLRESLVSLGDQASPWSPHTPGYTPPAPFLVLYQTTLYTLVTHTEFTHTHTLLRGPAYQKVFFWENYTKDGQHTRTLVCRTTRNMGSFLEMQATQEGISLKGRQMQENLTAWRLQPTQRCKHPTTSSPLRKPKYRCGGEDQCVRGWPPSGRPQTRPECAHCFQSWCPTERIKMPPTAYPRRLYSKETFL